MNHRKFLLIIILFVFLIFNLNLLNCNQIHVEGEAVTDRDHVPGLYDLLILLAPHEVTFTGQVIV